MVSYDFGYVPFWFEFKFIKYILFCRFPNEIPWQLFVIPVEQPVRQLIILLHTEKIPRLV